MISKKPKLRSVAVLGAGAWGATLAWLLSTGGHPVSLWGRDRDKMLALSQSRRHEDPVPIELCASVEITSELDDAIDGADIVIIASPSQALEQVTELLSRALSRRSGKRFPALVSAAKGI
ncbi:MAG: NAD(P)-binding domain-containing protein, partial [Candidatus Obscuribacterales bacterium]|nr:NAD(P)-binding domain-containing protein [Candidatus Obscuribacterales bacterium]